MNDKEKKKLNFIELMIFYFFIPMAVSIIIFFILLLAFGQHLFFFHPTHSEEYYAKLSQNEEFEEIKIESGEMSLGGWLKYDYILGKDLKKPLVISFWGNADNTSGTLGNFYENGIMNIFKGYNVISVDFPGYGLSEGTPSDTSMYEMSLAVYDYAKELDCVDTENIIVLGFSIGNGAATYLASQRKVNGLILVAPYDNALSLYNSRFNIFHGPLKSLTKYKFPSDLYAKEVEVAPLIIASKSDEIIPYELSVNLSKCFEEVYDFVTMENVKHGGFFGENIVREKIKEYLLDKLDENT